MCGFIAQLVEHRTGIAEVTGSNPIEALIFSGFFFPIVKLENSLWWSLFTFIYNRSTNMNYFIQTSQRHVVIINTTIILALICYFKPCFLRICNLVTLNPHCPGSFSKYTMHLIIVLAKYQNDISRNTQWTFVLGLVHFLYECFVILTCCFSLRVNSI